MSIDNNIRGEYGNFSCRQVTVIHTTSPTGKSGVSNAGLLAKKTGAKGQTPVFRGSPGQQSEDEVIVMQAGKVVIVPKEPLTLPPHRKEVWSMDFAMNSLANGGQLKVLALVDDCTKEAEDLVARLRGYPTVVRTDQGPEFTGSALDQ